MQVKRTFITHESETAFIVMIKAAGPPKKLRF